MKLLRSEKILQKKTSIIKFTTHYHMLGFFFHCRFWLSEFGKYVKNGWKGRVFLKRKCMLDAFFKPNLGLQILTVLKISTTLMKTRGSALSWACVAHLMIWNLVRSIYGRSSIELLISFWSINKHGCHRQFLF
jgi:hypothetical protein